MSIINLEEYNQIDLMMHVCLCLYTSVSAVRTAVKVREVKPFISDPHNAGVLCVLNILSQSKP